MSDDPYKLLREWVDPETGGTLPQMYRLQILELLKDRDEKRRDYEHACMTVAKMHEAAMGKVTGPNKGVVEDVLDLRLYAEHLKLQIDGLAKVLMAEFGGPTEADVDNGACGMAVRLLREFRAERTRPAAVLTDEELRRLAEEWLEAVLSTPWTPENDRQRLTALLRRVAEEARRQRDQEWLALHFDGKHPADCVCPNCGYGL